MTETDDRPSIAELRRQLERDTFTSEAVIIAALPVLLEIAAALVVHAADLEDRAIEGADYHASPEGESLLIALSRVRP